MLSVALFNAKLVVDVAFLVLQYSALTLSMVIENNLFVQCQVGHEFLIVS